MYYDGTFLEAINEGIGKMKEEMKKELKEKSDVIREQENLISAIRNNLEILSLDLLENEYDGYRVRECIITLLNQIDDFYEDIDYGKEKN